MRYFSASVLALAALMAASPLAAQTLQQTSCAIPGGSNSTVTATNDTDVEATFASVADACTFLATTPLNEAQCKTPTAFTIEWQFSTTAEASNGELEIFATPDDGECATYSVPSSTDYFYRGVVSGVPSAVTAFPGGADNNGNPLTVQNGLSLDTRAIMQTAHCCDVGGDASPACDGVVFDLCVVVVDNNLSPPGLYNAYMQFYVDTVAPPAVTGVTAASGDGLVDVTWAADTENVQDYHINIYNPDGTLKEKVTVASTLALTATVVNLTNDTNYSVTVSAADYAGNLSPESAPVSFTPRDQCDAWECYSGREKSGFCFISTAAYGSYDAATVQVFRDFRDRVLLKFALGRALVLAYYANGVAPAVWLARHAWARNAVAAALRPIGLAAALVVRAGAASAAILWLLTLALIISLRRYSKAALVLVLFLVPLHAHAQSEPPDDGFGGRNPAMAMDHDFDEQQPEAPDGPSRPRIGLAFKLGSYRPNIDSDPAANGWYAYYFGQSAAAAVGAGRKLYWFGEGDVYIWREFGLLGVSGGVGYWKAQTHSRVCADSSGNATPCTAATLHASTAGSDLTTFTIVPITLSVVYKLDVFLERWHVPLIPYVRGGLDCDIWFIQGSGRQAVKAEWMGHKNVQGLGATFGAHLRPGLAIDLAWADFLHILGTVQAAVTFEWRIESINNFGSHQSWDLADSSFLAGLEVMF